MKVVIFTQAYNAAKTLPRTIDSILGQTFQNIEYYILDNGSTDETFDIILDYAMRDRRIFPLSIQRNYIRNGGIAFSTLIYASDADYIVWCDADDTYSLDFLEKMTAFAGENRLDIAACGYDMVDGVTGKVIKHRALPENMVLQGQAFTDRFIEYRGFTSFLWGKLYSLPYIRAIYRQPKDEGYALCDDSIMLLSFFQAAERAGIYAEAMYQYYQYPTSVSSLHMEENIKSHTQQWFATKRYLEHYGPISRENEDFLYAIYLSLADDSVERAFASDLPATEKLKLLRMTFQEPLWAETLARKADPRFRNLAGRREYVAQVKERIFALADTSRERELAEAAVRALDQPIAKG